MSETSKKQLEANRQNSKKGGVKTEKGKAISRYNALKHGLLSQKVLFEGEDQELLAGLGKLVRADLKPMTEIERFLVDRIVANLWRLQRAMKLEEGAVISDFGGFTGQSDTFFRYEAMLERGIYKALHELQRIQAVRAGEQPYMPLAEAFNASKE